VIRQCLSNKNEMLQYQKQKILPSKQGRSLPLADDQTCCELRWRRGPGPSASGTAARASMPAPGERWLWPHGGRLARPCRTASSRSVPMRRVASARSLRVRRLGWSRKKRDIVFIDSNYEELPIDSGRVADDRPSRPPCMPPTMRSSRQSQSSPSSFFSEIVASIHARHMYVLVHKSVAVHKHSAVAFGHQQRVSRTMRRIGGTPLVCWMANNSLKVAAVIAGGMEIANRSNDRWRRRHMQYSIQYDVVTGG